MNTEFRPNVAKIIVESIFSHLLIFVIAIGFLIGAGFFFNFLESAGNSAPPTYFLLVFKIFIYGFLSIVILSVIFSFINLVGNTLTTIYSIDENYISRKTTFLTEVREDVPIKQVTNTDYAISWFWDKIFKTGSIQIFTSGSAGADMSLYAIESVIDKFDNIKSKVDTFREDIIKKQESKLIKTVKPNVAIAVILTLFYGGIFYLFFAIQFLTLLGSWVLLIFAFILILITTLTTMAYKRKQYDFYTDRLEYYDGFLTFHKVSVPLERITNIDLNRNLIDRIFGVSTIKVDTAGSMGSEINIRFVNDGEPIVEELKEVLKENGRN